MSEISWTIELPKKKQAVLGQAKPKAKILLETEVGGTEEFFVFISNYEFIFNFFNI